MRQVVRWAEKRLARSPLCVRAATALRNHCNILLGFHYATSIDRDLNGEARFLRAIADEVGSFVDVGANAGQWARVAVASLPPGVRGVCVEPNPALITRLTEAVADAPGVAVRNCGASDQPGEMVLHVPERTEHATFASGANGAGGKPVEVKVETVDRLVTEHLDGGVDLLKIDAEGWDFHVLRGAEKTLRDRRVKYVQFEYGDNWQRSGSTLQATASWLERLGYELRAIVVGGAERIDPRATGEFFRYSNFVVATQERMSALEQRLAAGQ